MFNPFQPPPFPTDAAADNDTPISDVWIDPLAMPQDLASGQHVVVQGAPSPLNPFAEPSFDTVIATEEDFEDDCPLCESMRARVRAGERIEILKVTWE